MNLLALMGVEYRRSRWALYASLLCGAAVYGVVLLDTISEHKISGPLAPGALVLQVLALVLKHVSTTHYSRAEEIRRIAVLKDGLGIEPPQIVMAKIVSRSGNASPPTKLHVGKYFASEAPPGVSRFLENIEESSFWTHRIASFTGNLGLFAVIVGVAISVGALFAFINAGVPPSALHSAAEAVVVSLGFVVAGDFLILSLQYRELSQEACRRMEDAAAQLESERTERDAAIFLFSEYNCNLSGAPPLPSFLYRLLHKRLSDGWAARNTRIPVE